ncbi:MAG: hypothetical protein Hals2KO_21660 [Halioglobus sp.]
MFIALSTPTYDLDGSLLLEPLPSSDFGTLQRRGNKVPTLDAGVAVQDFGYTDADREFTVDLRVSPAQSNQLRELVRLYPRIYAATPEGFFEVIPSYAPRIDGATLTLSVTEKLA